MGRCIELKDELIKVERGHDAEREVLRVSLRKAEALLPEQWESGFVEGLKQAPHKKRT